MAFPIGGVANSSIVIGVGGLPGDNWDNRLASNFFGNELSSERSKRFADDDGGDGSEEDAQRAEEPDNTGARLAVVPVGGDYGHSDFVYLDVVEPELAITPDNPLIFFSNNRFASLQLPELAGGGTASYQLRFSDQTQAVASGDTIDFTTIDPNGVRSFRLWTSDPADSLPEAAAFTFLYEGPTDVWQGPLVPEPSSLVLAVCAAIGTGIIAINRWRLPAPRRHELERAGGW